MTKNLKIGLGVGGIAIAALIAWLALGVFGIQTLFIDETVSEANPFANQTAALAVGDAPTEAQLASTEVGDQPAPSDPQAATDTSGSTAATDTAIDPAPTDASAADVTTAAAASEPVAVEAAVPEIVTLASGSLIDHDHSGEGTVTVLTDGNQRFLRFEDDFAVDNGPDLNVYLVRGVDADGDPGLFDDDFIDLGDLKGNIGAQNYELAADVDLSEYDTVVIWCVRFGVAFNAADLT